MYKKASEVDLFLKKFSPAYPIVLIYGPDRGAVSERAQKFAHNLGLPLDDPFVTIRFDAPEMEAHPYKLQEEASTFSFTKQSRFIWIKNASSQKALIATLKDFVKAPPPDCFILIEGGDLKKNAALRTLIEKAPQAMALPCYHNERKDLYALIEEISAEFNISFSPTVKNFLCSALGADQLASRGEIEKLCLYAYDQKDIRLEEVKALILDSALYALDDLCNALLLADIGSLEQHFNKQARLNSSLYPILYTVQRQLQQMQYLRYRLENENIPLTRAKAETKPPIFFKKQKILQTALPYWSSRLIQKALNKLYHAWLMSRKNTQLEKEIIGQALLSLAYEAALVKKKHYSHPSF